MLSAAVRNSYVGVSALGGTQGGWWVPITYTVLVMKRAMVGELDVGEGEESLESKQAVVRVELISPPLCDK